MKKSALVLMSERGQAGTQINLEEAVMTGIEFVLAVAIFIPVAWQLEVTHRRTRDLPRIPFGADAESEASAEYRRQIAELRQLSQLSTHSDRDR